MGEGTGEWYRRRAFPVWDGDRGGPGRRRAGWLRLRSDGIELDEEKERELDVGDDAERSVEPDLCLEDLLGDCELLELGEDLSEDGVAGRLGHGGGH